MSECPILAPHLALGGVLFPSLFNRAPFGGGAKMKRGTFPYDIPKRMTSPNENADKHPGRLALGIAFFCVYVFWGSTYLGMHYAGLYFSPPMVSGLRFLLAAPTMFLICWWRGVRLRVSWAEFLRLSLVGVLLLTGNNVLLVWGERTVDSGMAALVMAVVPLFVALIEIFLPGGERLNRLGWLGILLGFAGLLVLLSPSLRTMSPHSPPQVGAPYLIPSSGKVLGFAILMIAGISWAVGSVASRRFALKVDPFVASAWQMLVAGVVDLSIATGAGAWETAQWTRPAVIAIVYMAIFGSLVAFSAYIYLLHHVPVAKAATYAYVNPVVAVLLGAVFVGERLVPMEYAGMGIVLLAVALVTASKTKTVATGRDEELAVES